MIKHSLKIALRFLVKRKGITFIHLFGLTTGIAVFWIILQYVNFEKSYDRFHSKADQIFRIDINFYRDGAMIDGDAMNYPPTGPTMVDELSEVISFVRITPEYGKVIFKRGEALHEETKVFYADSTMFDIFDFPFVAGTPESALNGENKLVLTLSLAEKYFGARNHWKESPVGQLINFNNEKDLVVSAIIEDPPETAHLKFNALISINTFWKVVGDYSNYQWGWNDFYTYVLTTPGTTQKQLQSKLEAFVDKYKEKGHGNVFIATPLTNIHLFSHQSDEPEANGDIDIVNALMIIAFVILVIAWINYINLSTARGEERSKEVGIRKVNGAHRAGLVMQFLSESFLLNLVAIILSLVIAYLVLPMMGAILGKSLTFDMLDLPGFWFGVLALLIGGTLLSGLYPAFVLSSFTPSYVLTGSSKKLRNKDLFRKGLVTFQFIIAIALIIGTIVIYNQVNYLQNKKLGFNLTDKIIINAPGVYSDSIFEKKYLTFKNELKQIVGVNDVTISSAIPGGNLEYEVDVVTIKLEGKNDNDYHRIWLYTVDHDFIDVYNLEVIAGYQFLANSKTTKVMVNRSASRLFGYHQPAKIIGEKFWYRNQMAEIVGVVEDYHHQSAKSAFLPMVMINDIQSMLYYTVDVHASVPTNFNTTLSNIRSSWMKVYPENPFSYFFLEDRYNYQYQADLQTGKVFFGFSLFAILITCLGLLGISSYMVIIRTKEISIRKVLGATRKQIVFLLSKDFIQLLGLAALLAIPLGYHYFNLWLEGFAFRINISGWLLILPVIFVTLVSLIIVSAFSFKAASVNPSETLRSE